MVSKSSISRKRSSSIMKDMKIDADTSITFLL